MSIFQLMDLFGFSLQLFSVCGSLSSSCRYFASYSVHYTISVVICPICAGIVLLSAHILPVVAIVLVGIICAHVVCLGHCV